MSKKKILGLVVAGALGVCLPCANFLTVYATSDWTTEGSVAADANKVDTVYTQDVTIEYDANCAYELDVNISSSVGVMSYNVTISMPEFARVNDVYAEGNGTMQYNQLDERTVAIVYTSSEAISQGRLFTINYSLIEAGNYSGAPSVGDTQFVTQQVTEMGETVPVEVQLPVQLGVINVVHNTENTRLMGDVTNDGNIDLQDLIRVQQSMVNPYYPLTEEETLYADIDKNGNVDLIDCQYIQMYIVGEVNTLENVNGGNDTVVTYQVTVRTNVDGGEIMGAGAYNNGAVAVLAVKCYEGYTFTGWYDQTGKVVSSNTRYSFTVTQNVSLTARFETVEQTEECVITVSSTVDGATQGGGVYVAGEWVTIEAMPMDGYTFLGWHENGVLVSTEFVYSFVASTSTEYVAQWEVQGEIPVMTYNVNVSTNLPYEGGVVGAGAYEAGYNVVLFAGDYTAYGYEFRGWYDDNGKMVSSDSVYTFTLTGDVNLQALYAQVESEMVTYTLNIVVNGEMRDSLTVAVPYATSIYDAVTARLAEAGYNFEYLEIMSEDGSFITQGVMAPTDFSTLIVELTVKEEIVEYQAWLEVTLINQDGNMEKTSVECNVVEGTNVWTLADRVSNYNGRYYLVEVYADAEFKTPVSSDMLVENGMTYYVKATETAEAFSGDFRFVTIQNGTVITEYSMGVTVPAGTSLREYALQTYNGNPQVCDYYDLVEVYADDALSAVVTDSDVVTGDFTVFIVVVRKTVTGTFTISGVMNEVAVDGTVTLNADGSADVNLGWGEMFTSDSGTYVISSGLLLVRAGNFRQYAFMLDLDSNQAYFYQMYDATEYEYTETYVAVEGQYTINDPSEGVAYSVTLYGNGVYEMAMGELVVIGDFFFTGDIYTFNSLGSYMQARKSEDGTFERLEFQTLDSQGQTSAGLTLMEADVFQLRLYSTGEMVCGTYAYNEDGRVTLTANDGRSYLITLGESGFLFDGETVSDASQSHVVIVYMCDQNGNIIDSAKMSAYQGQYLATFARDVAMSNYGYTLVDGMVYADANFSTVISDNETVTGMTEVYIQVVQNSTGEENMQSDITVHFMDQNYSVINKTSVSVSGDASVAVIAREMIEKYGYKMMDGNVYLDRKCSEMITDDYVLTAGESISVYVMVMTSEESTTVSATVVLKAVQTDGTTEEYGNYGLSFQQGACLAEIGDKFSNYNGYQYTITYYADADYKQEFSASTEIENGATYYVLMTQVQTYQLGITFCTQGTDGTVLPLGGNGVTVGTNVDIRAKVIEAFSGSGASQYYDLIEIYADAALTQVVADGTVIAEDTQVYVKVEEKSFVGVYTWMDQQGAEIGTLEIVDDSNAVLTDLTAIRPFEGTYFFQGGALFVKLADYHQYGFAFNAETKTVIAMYEYDGTNNEEQAELAKYAGTYTIVDTTEGATMQYSCVLTSSGSYSLTYGGMEMIGYYFVVQDEVGDIVTFNQVGSLIQARLTADGTMTVLETLAYYHHYYGSMMLRLLEGGVYEMQGSADGMNVTVFGRYVLDVGANQLTLTSDSGDVQVLTIVEGNMFLFDGESLDDVGGDGEIITPTESVAGTYATESVDMTGVVSKSTLQLTENYTFLLQVYNGGTVEKIEGEYTVDGDTVILMAGGTYYFVAVTAEGSFEILNVYTESETYMAFTGEYDFPAGNGKIDLLNNGIAVMNFNDGGQDFATYTVISDNVIEIEGGQLMVDRETMQLIPITTTESNNAADVVNG